MKRFLFFLLLLGLSETSAQAVTRYASANGTQTNCTTMQTPNTGTAAGSVTAAVGCMAAGDRLELRAGTYSVSGLPNVPSGTGVGSETIIAAYGATTGPTGEQVIFTGGQWPDLYGSGLHHIKFIGKIIFQGTGQSVNNLQQLIAIDNDTGTTHHITFDGTRITAWGATAIGIGGDDVTLQNCEIDHVGYGHDTQNQHGYAVYLGAGQRTIIEHCHIHHIGGYGFHQYVAVEDRPPGGRAGGNHIYRYNTMHDTGEGTPAVNTYTGILLRNGQSGHQVYGNVIYNVAVGWGIFAAEAPSALVYNNTVYNMTATDTAGIRVESANVAVRNNIVAVTGSGNYIENTSGTTTFSTNLCGSAGSNCATNQTPNAIFNNPGTDFTLKAGSAAINTGDNLGPAYSPDIAGVPRSTGGPWSIGAYEYGVALPPVSQMVLALPLDEGTGTVAADVSGQKNNATLIGGSTWTSGKYGNAVQLDGTGYLNIPSSSTLALAPAMTLEAWVYPTATFSSLTAVIVHSKYVLYAASDPAYCPAPTLAPMGGYVDTTEAFQKICATSIPPLNTWSHLAITYDGATLTFYLDGKPIASQPSTTPMVQTSYPATIGASEFGENFIGKIDESRVYNYARNPLQIVSDMNTPLIGVPGKVVEIAAPVSVEISSASSIEISAD